MERSELEAILDARLVKLDSIEAAILRLDKAYEQIVTLLTGQARQEEKLNGLTKEVEGCKETHDEAFSRIRALEMDSGAKTWDILKLIGAALLAGVVGVAVGRMKT